jgi:tripartite-type tricarboxylate transporter receptor subunit TctC
LPVDPRGAQSNNAAEPGVYTGLDGEDSVKPFERRLCAIAAAAFAVVSVTNVQAQNYPAQTIHMIVGFPAGSGADIYARYFASKLQQVSKTTVLVENKPGAAASIAAEYVARSKPDGYTIFIGGSDSFGAPLYTFKNPPTDPRKDFVYVSPVVSQSFLFTVPANSPHKTVAELTAALKTKKDKGSYAATNNTAIILGETYKQSAGLETVQVNYRTNVDYVNDLAGGRLDFVLVDPVFGTASIRDGKMRALAVSTGKRIKALPDVPTMQEAGIPDVDINQWWLIAAPAGTPAPIVERLNGWFTEIGKMDETREFLGKNGVEPWTASAAETKARIDKEIANWANYVKIAKIEPQ